MYHIILSKLFCGTPLKCNVFIYNHSAAVILFVAIRKTQRTPEKKNTSLEKIRFAECSAKRYLLHNESAKHQKLKMTRSTEAYQVKKNYKSLLIQRRHKYIFIKKNSKVYRLTVEEFFA